MDIVGNMSDSIHAIHRTLSKILTFKDEWFTISDDYELQLGILDAMLLSYREQFVLHKQPTDSPEMKILKKAEISLRKVESRLIGWQKFTEADRCCSHARLWFAKLVIAVFPENIELTVKKVEEDIKKIGTVIEERGKFIARMQEEQRRKAIKKMVHNTDLYIPIQDPQSAIMKAINKAEGHSVILLHGGVGRGKSILAKCIFFSYGEKRDNANPEDAEIQDPSQRFPIWVSCSNCSKDDISPKQLEILQTYSPSSLGDFVSKEKTGPNSRIAQALRDFLSGKKALIILDDVADLEFLYEMWASTSGDGRDVKYLVTSQKAYICDRVIKPKCVAMERPTQDEAMRILASLVGLESIPEELERIAQQIIEAVDRNPLALACVATQFRNSTNKTVKREWKEVHRGIANILTDKHVKEESCVLGSTPRSLAAAMESCINDLDSLDARKMLFLMYECKGEVVPEAVLRMLHARIRTSSCTFSMLLNELVMRELLRPAVNTKSQGENGGDARSWSLGSLAKIFIEHLVDSKEIRSMISDLVGEPVGDEGSALHATAQFKQGRAGGSRESEKATVLLVLCALYFDQSHSDVYESVTKALDRAHIKFADDSFDALRRQAVEPLVCLLDKHEEDEDESNAWTIEDAICVTKVFLAYICNGQLDGEKICHLLRLEACLTTKLAVLETITNAGIIEEKPLFNKDNLILLIAVAHLIKSSKDVSTPCIHIAALNTLNAVCWKCRRDESLSSCILDQPSVLDVLVNSLSSPIEVSRRYAANSFISLSYNSDINTVKIANNQGALVGLVKCLSEDKDPALQLRAAKALFNLAMSDGESVRIMIAKTKGAMAAIEMCMAKLSHPELQREIAQILCLLAESGESRGVLKERKNLSKGLSALLEDGMSPEIQESAAYSLTLVDLKQSQNTILTSAWAYKGRADALILLEKYAEAMLDLDQAIVQGVEPQIVFRKRCQVRAKLEHFEGALEDINLVLDVGGDNEKPFNLQERGVLKQMMGDLQGSLKDFDEGLKLEPDDYERLKYRGYVKFLLKDNEGAHADAKWALRIKPKRVDRFLYGKNACLGTGSVEFLGYLLK